MIKRRLENRIQETLQRSPSVALMGPRQVGKTTLAFNISDTRPAIYLDLESGLDLQKVRDITAFHSANSDKLIILDEIHRLPEVFAPCVALSIRSGVRGTKLVNFYFWVLPQLISCNSRVSRLQEG